jgi:hypothetical protein
LQTRRIAPALLQLAQDGFNGLGGEFAFRLMDKARQAYIQTVGGSRKNRRRRLGDAAVHRG